MAAKREDKTVEAARESPKLDRLLTAAANLMARQGFGQTSIRNVARETGFSLAGMYYYFQNKEDLLYQIQHRTFGALLEKQETAIAEIDGAEDRLRSLIQNHLEYFTRHFSELKVCTFELGSLSDERYRAIAELRRRYYGCLAGVIRELLEEGRRKRDLEQRVRHLTLFVFGMLNWIFMWYDPDRDSPVAELGDEMVALVMNGLGRECR